MRKARPRKRTEHPAQTPGMRATRLVMAGKAIVTSGVGLIEFFSATALDRGPWLTFWQVEPRWVGLLLFMWGGTDFTWQPWLRFRMRRAWWYCIVSSAAAIPVSIAAASASALPHPNVLLLVGGAGIVSLVFLSVFESAFNVRL